MREALEGMVARLAAERRTSEHISELRRIVDLGTRAATDGDLAALPALNTDFHRVLSSAANNSLLTDTVERMAQLIQWVYTKRITQRGTRSWAEHARIVDAIVDGDADRAFNEACAHIANARVAYLHDQLSHE